MSDLVGNHIVVFFHEAAHIIMSNEKTSGEDSSTDETSQALLADVHYFFSCPPVSLTTDWPFSYEPR